MKKINYLKFILSTVMVIIFTLLFNKMILGMTFHEVAGLIVGVLVLVHCGLNWRWIKAVTLKVFSNETTIKTKITYITDLLLLICVGVIIVTGIFISKVVFSGLGLGGGRALQGIHITAAYFALMLIGVHLGLHWNWVMNVFKKAFRIPEKKVLVYVSRVVVAVVFVFGVYSTYSVGFLSKISFANTEGRGNGQFGPGSRSEGRKSEREEFAPGQMPGGERKEYNSREVPQGGNQGLDQSQIPQTEDGSLEGFNQGNAIDGYENGSSSNSEIQEESSGIAIQKLSAQTKSSEDTQIQGRNKGGTQRSNGGQSENNSGEQGSDNGQEGFPPNGMNGEFKGNFPGGNRGNMGSTSVLGVIFSYLGVISMFAIATYYIEKLVRLRKKKMLLLPATTLALEESSKN